uniref:Uncharacterized protein n=1 Tax=Pipistrellus kuhlii TaxID=59472 RepID=A0A7J7UGH2_PIPKU|nr:hypothetical protein mPipKuh1_009088 [Pipistrellus kuhlii]
MDKPVLLLLLLLLLQLGGFPFMFFQGVDPATLCMVCSYFKKGHCLRDKGNCTMKQGPGCRTRDFFIFTDKGGWSYAHTELDCAGHCSPSPSYHGALKIVTFCCQGLHFCNRIQRDEQEDKL